MLLESIFNGVAATDSLSLRSSASATVKVVNAASPCFDKNISASGTAKTACVKFVFLWFG